MTAKKRRSKQQKRKRLSTSDSSAPKLSTAESGNAAFQSATDRSGVPSPVGSKKEMVLGMLRKQGTSVVAVMEVTGWQEHSVRAFFATVVKKKLGLNLVSQKVDGHRIYRIDSPYPPQ
jgi:hypothetical protein